MMKRYCCVKTGVQIFFFLADSGCFVFARLFVLGSLQFWESSDRFFIFFSLCCCHRWLLVSCFPWHCALSREGLKEQRRVCNENEVSLLDLIFFFFFFFFFKPCGLQVVMGWQCVVGSVFFSRAPVLVAIALMEAGMKYEDAVELIRQWVSHSQSQPALV